MERGGEELIKMGHQLTYLIHIDPKQYIRNDNKSSFSAITRYQVARKIMRENNFKENSC